MARSAQEIPPSYDVVDEAKQFFLWLKMCARNPTTTLQYDTYVNDFSNAIETFEQTLSPIGRNTYSELLNKATNEEKSIYRYILRARRSELTGEDVVELNSRLTQYIYPFMEKVGFLPKRK